MNIYRDRATAAQRVHVAITNAKRESRKHFKLQIFKRVDRRGASFNWHYRQTASQDTAHNNGTMDNRNRSTRATPHLPVHQGVFDYRRTRVGLESLGGREDGIYARSVELTWERWGTLVRG